MSDLLQLLVDLPAGLAVLLKLTVLLAVGWALHWMLRGGNPRWRRFAWRGILVGLFLVPLLSFFGPPIELTVKRTQVAGAVTSVSLESFESASIADDLLVSAPGSLLPSGETRYGAAPVSSPPSRWVELRGWLEGHVVFMSWMSWGAIGLLLALRVLVASFRFRSTVRTSAPVPENVLQAFRKVARNLGCLGRVDLRVSPDVRSPFLWGSADPSSFCRRRWPPLPKQNDLAGSSPTSCRTSVPWTSGGRVPFVWPRLSSGFTLCLAPRRRA